MADLVIIAGPQAAGKSTLIASLEQQFLNVSAFFSELTLPVLFVMQESRQIIVHRHMLLGAYMMTEEHEREIMLCDLERMGIILKRNQDGITYLDECNVFTLAHAEAHGMKVRRGDWWSSYMKFLKQLRTKIIFLDVPPGVSWGRRWRKYQQKLIYCSAAEREEVSLKRRDYLEKLYPLLLALYDKLDFPKVKIDAQQAEEDVLAEVAQALADFRKM